METKSIKKSYFGKNAFPEEADDYATNNIPKKLSKSEMGKYVIKENSTKNVGTQNTHYSTESYFALGVIVALLISLVVFIVKFRKSILKVQWLILKIALMFLLFYAGTIGFGKSMGMYDVLRLSVCVGTIAFGVS